MAMKVLTNLDLNQNQLQKAVVEVLATAPTAPVEGQIYYNSASDTLQFYTGSAWITLGNLSQITAPSGNVNFNSKVLNNVANPVAGTDGANRQYVLGLTVNNLTAPTTDFNMNNKKITNVATPTGANDAVNKAYVDNLSVGIDAKASVVVGTTGNITLSGLQAIDGYTVVAGDRVLVKNQTTASQNGIYTASATAWVRGIGMDASNEFTGAFTFIEKGTTQADTGWLCTTDNPMVVGTTAVNWVQFSSAGQITYTNVGAGVGIYKGKTGNNVDLKSIVTDNSGLKVTSINMDTEIEIAVDKDSLGASGFVRTFAISSTGTTGSMSVTHNLSNGLVDVFVMDKSTTPWTKCFVDFDMVDSDTTTVVLPTRTVGQYQIVIKA